MKIPDMILKLREQSEMTQDELAKRAHVSQSSISKYENGTSDLTVSQLEKIARVFNRRVVLSGKEITLQEGTE